MSALSICPCCLSLYQCFPNNRTHLQDRFLHRNSVYQKDKKLNVLFKARVESTKLRPLNLLLFSFSFPTRHLKKPKPSTEYSCNMHNISQNFQHCLYFCNGNYFIDFSLINHFLCLTSSLGLLFSTQGAIPSKAQQASHFML